MAVLLAGIVVFVSLASGDSALHHWIHSDSSQPAHWCAITAVEHGQLDVALTSVSAMRPALPALPDGLPFESVFISRDFPFHPERGPPAQS
jgi:hypothetical protein